MRGTKNKHIIQSYLNEIDFKAYSLQDMNMDKRNMDGHKLNMYTIQSYVNNIWLLGYPS